MVVVEGGRVRAQPRETGGVVPWWWWWLVGGSLLPRLVLHFFFHLHTCEMRLLTFPLCRAVIDFPPRVRACFPLWKSRDRAAGALRSFVLFGGGWRRTVRADELRAGLGLGWARAPAHHRCSAAARGAVRATAAAPSANLSCCCRHCAGPARTRIARPLPCCHLRREGGPRLGSRLDRPARARGSRPSRPGAARTWHRVARVRQVRYTDPAAGGSAYMPVFSARKEYVY